MYCLQGGEDKNGAPKWLPKPLVFYHWVEKKSNKNGGHLEVVGIQLDASTDPVNYTRKNSRVYTPKEEHPNDWTFAKILAQVGSLSSDAVWYSAGLHSYIKCSASRTPCMTRNSTALLGNLHLFSESAESTSVNRPHIHPRTQISVHVGCGLGAPRDEHPPGALSLYHRAHCCCRAPHHGRGAPDRAAAQHAPALPHS